MTILKSMAPSGVGEDEQLVAAVGDAILHAGLARRDQARRRVGIGKIDQTLLGRLVVAAGDDAEAAARALLDMREPAGVLFLVDQHVVGLRRAEAVPKDLQRAVVGVEPDVEEGVESAVQTTLPSVSSTTSGRSCAASASRGRGW